ncbi:uncharacterized protein LOC132266213 [Cornus florida]|uniref:uncharacterized protein LOC132266213 n=1 Tax=Cornus florida TaxID=4283 RepID=UPI0028A2D2AB|nr:uncharacterized protein LOC132266213 [Cornus florida]
MNMWNNIRRIIQLYDDEDDNESVLIFAAILEEQNFYQKSHCRDLILQGEAYVMEILNGHKERCYENFRMYPEIFRTLCSTLKVCQLGTHIIAPPDFSVIPNKIKDSSRFNPYFKHYVGAIDGTHIPATLPVATQLPFRGRKGYTTQNVMAVCDFDMRFTYVLAGWEGSANDSRILKEYIENEEYRRSKPPRGREEVFNHRHSFFRNIIEQCFGLLKMRFVILKAMPPYKFSTQVLIVMACCTLHNFIRNQYQPDDLFDGDDPPQRDGEDDEIVEHVLPAQLREMDQLRNTIAD